jgi:hypothetical protein
MIKPTAFETDRMLVEASGYRITSSRGYFYPQKQVRVPLALADTSRKGAGRTSEAKRKSLYCPLLCHL